MDSRQAELLRVVVPGELGSRLRAERIAKGLTQGDLAGDTVSVGYISRIEAGQRRPTADVLEALAERLEVSLDLLLTGVEVHHLDEIRVLLDFAELALESGDPAGALTQARDGLEKALSAHQVDLVERGRLLVGRATEATGELEAAILVYEEALEQTRSWVTRLQIGIALTRCYREAGDLGLAIETALALQEEAEGAGLEGGDEQVQLTVTLASAYFERGDVSLAARTCEKAVRAADLLDSPTARAAAYWNASMIEAQRGRLHEAVPLARKALALLAEGSDARNLARLRTQLGVMQLQLEPPAIHEARSELDRAAEELQWSSANAVDKARNELGQARASLLEGDTDAAREVSERVLAQHAASAPMLAAQAYSLVGEAHFADGDRDAARRSYQAAVLAMTGIGSDREAAQRWYALAELLAQVGDEMGALQAYRSAGAAVGLRGYAAAGARQREQQLTDRLTVEA